MKYLMAPIVVRQLFREGERVTDEAGDALPHGIIEALDMIGFAGVLCDGFVLCRRNDPSVYAIVVEKIGLRKGNCMLLFVRSG